MLCNLKIIFRMKYLTIIFLTTILFISKSDSQLINSNRRTDWKNSGLNIPIPMPSLWKNVIDFGGNKNGIVDNTSAINAAIASLSGNQGIIYFPAGTYLFNSSINVPANVIIKGSSSDSTTFNFSLGGITTNCFNAIGTTSSVPITVTSAVHSGVSALTLSSSAGINIGDYIEMRVDGTGFMTSSWAMDDLAQICKVTAISGNTITIAKPLRWNFNLSTNPRVYVLNPIQKVGFECFKLVRLDSSANQSTLINFNYATNCWVKGVESFKTTFGHVSLSKSIHCEVTDCYFHHAWSYGDGGRAYGVVVQSSSSECLIHNNIFEHLRHSLLIQSGANGNVIGYNYSTDPFWEQGIFPSNSTGEIVLHGNYPFMNLIEGNIVDNIVIDNSHGLNGPFNTFIRNRASNYGFFMNTSAGDSNNFVNNELLKSTVFFVSTYNLTGSGNFEYGNNHNGSTKPTGTTTPSDITSYYIDATPTWFSGAGLLPTIGYTQAINSGTIPSKQRFSSNSLNRCACINRTPFDSSKISAGLDKSRFNCEGDSVKIGIEPISGFNYSWTPKTGLSNEKIANPFAKPSQTTSYILAAINSSLGITIMDTVVVSVNNRALPILTTNFSDSIINKGESVSIIASGAKTYLWTPNHYIIGLNNSNQLTVKPDTSITYQVKGMDSLGCFSVKNIRINVANKSSILDKENGVKIYPNPVTDLLLIDSEYLIELKVRDILGKLFFDTQKPSLSFQISIEDWPTGIYFVELKNSIGLLKNYKISKN